MVQVKKSLTRQVIPPPSFSTMGRPTLAETMMRINLQVALLNNQGTQTNQMLLTTMYPQVFIPMYPMMLPQIF